MSRQLTSLWVAVAILAAAGPLSAEEIQLAGIRLGQHVNRLLDVWGPPDGIVVGEGPEVAAPSQAQMPAGAAAPPLASAPGAGPGAMAGPGVPLPPGGAGPMMGPAGPEAMGLGPGPMPMAGPGGAGPMGGPPGVGPMGAPGGGAGPGMPGPAMGALGGAAAGAAPFPIWALPVWVTMRPGEVEWVYQRGPVVMGFVLDRDGYVTCIAVAGWECGWARSALWQPHRYIKLGDSLSRVIYRYGYPDSVETYTASGPSVGQNSITVTFGQVSRQFSRDCILRYEERNNIAFTLHDFKVVRIHIWQR
jgi:hypothetical protein